MAAAHKYQLWVNGAKLDTGPSFCFPDEQYYQATDVTSALRGRPGQRGRHPPPLVRARPGTPDVGPRPAGPGGRCTTPTDDRDASVPTAPGAPAGPSGCPPPSATTTAATSWSGSTAGAPRRVGGRRLRRPGWTPAAVLGPGGHRAVHRISTPSAPGSASTTVRAGLGADARRPARWWSTSARSTRPADRDLPPGTERPDRPHACGLHARSRRLGLDHPQHPGHRPARSPTSSATGPRPSTPTGTSGSATCRSTTRASPSARTRSTLAARHATMPEVPEATFTSSEPDARRGVGAVRPLGPLHLPGAVHRHPDPGEGPVPLGLVQRVPGGHADTAASRTSAGRGCGTWPGPRPATGPPPGRSTRSTPTTTGPRTTRPSPPCTPNGSGATTCPPATGPPWPACCPPSSACPTTWPVPSTRRPASSPDQPHVDQRRHTYGYDYDTDGRHHHQHPGRQRLPPDRRRWPRWPATAAQAARPGAAGRQR